MKTFTKKTNCLLTYILMLSSAFIFSNCESNGDDNIGPKMSEWTIIGYFDGNNNLDNGQLGTSYIIEDLQEMETAGSTDDVTSIIMLASQKTGGNATYYKVEKHSNQMPDEIKSPVLKDLGTKDMSDPQTLKEFIAYVVENYPAKKYALVLNSHGGGWTGICPDEVNGVGDLMSIPSLKSALSSAPMLDVLVFHSCLMGSIEVAYELRDKAKYMVASEINMPVLSILGADQWLAELIDNPQIESFDFAKRIAQCVYDRGNAAQRNTHMAVIDMTKMDYFASKISDLGNRLVSEGGSYWNEIKNAWSSTHYVSDAYPSLTDIREFAKQLTQQPNLNKINLISSATTNLLTALNEAVPFTKTNFTQKPCGGLSIHFPANETELDEQSYSKLEFDKTNWIGFLKEFINKNKRSSATISGSVSWSSHSLSNKCSIFVCYEENDELEILGEVTIPTDGKYSFTISDITQPQEYMFFVHDDINANDEIDSGDGTGFWDKNADKVWTFDDALTVEAGKEYSNINMTIEELKSANINTYNLISQINQHDLNKIPVLK